MSPIFIALGIVIFLVLVILLWYISVMNNFKSTKVKIKQAESGIDVALTKRYDVLTKMLDVTKGYAKHERDVITETINLRSGMTLKEKSDVSAQMDTVMGRINVVAEAYPDLRSSENFKQLQIAIMDVEEHLQASRRQYNGNVSIYNQMVVTFPNSIVAKNIGAIEEPFFEAEATKREDVKMQF